MLAKAKAILTDKTTTVQNYEEFKQVLEAKGGFIKAAWCGSPECEAKVKDETGATIRIRPFQTEKPTTDCVVCDKEAPETAYWARSY
ncbi:MAG: proline--tRNA ligase, partial [Betaproteobacteria bacterium]